MGLEEGFLISLIGGVWQFRRLSSRSPTHVGGADHREPE